jgi:hypothetical protein
MYRALNRAVRLVVSPDEEWRTIVSEVPDPRSVLFLFVLPMACIPAVAWSFNLSLFGSEGGLGRERVALETAQVLRSGFGVWASSVLSVLVLAAAIYLLAPLFVPARDWPRALIAASYSAAPLFLGGVILAFPDLAFACLLAAFQGCYLLYCGVQHVIGVKEDKAAEFVALSIVLLIFASTILGSLGSAAGVL